MLVVRLRLLCRPRGNFRFRGSSKETTSTSPVRLLNPIQPLNHEIVTATMFRTTRALQAMQPTRAMFMQQSPRLYMRQTARMMAPVPVSCPQE
jgi:hypothetical protein